MADGTSNKTGEKGTALEDPAHPKTPSRVDGNTPYDTPKSGAVQPTGGVAEAGDGAEPTVKPGAVDPSGGAASGGAG